MFLNFAMMRFNRWVYSLLAGAMVFSPSVCTMYSLHSWAIWASLMVKACTAAAPAFMAAFWSTIFKDEQLAMVIMAIAAKANNSFFIQFLSFTLDFLTAKLRKIKK